MKESEKEHEPCNQIITLSTTVKIYMSIISTISLLLVGWATYITVEQFAGKTANAVQLTKIDYIILDKLNVIERKIDKLDNVKK